MFLAIVAVFVVWNRMNARLSGDSFSPLHVMYFSWVLPLSLRTLHLSEGEETWTPATIAVLLYVTTALASVSLIAAYQVRRYPFAGSRVEFDRTMQQLTVRRNVIVLCVVWLAVFGAYIYAEFLTSPYGIPIVTLRNNLSIVNAHRWGKDTRWAAVTSLLTILTPLLYLAARESVQYGRRFVLFAMTFAYPLFGLLKLSRSDVLFAFLNIGATELYRRRFRSRRLRMPRLSPFKWVLLVAVGIGFLGLTFRLRTTSALQSSSYAHDIAFRWRTGPGVEGLAQVYGYAALPFENFHRFFSTYEGGFNPGISFLRPLLSMAGQGRLADRMLADIPFNSLSSSAGSHTFLPDLYAEFGLAGLLVIPVLYAVFVNLLYVRLRRKPSLVNLLLYVNFLFPWAWLFFNNAFSVLSFYINAVFILVLDLVLRFLRPHRVGRRQRALRAAATVSGGS